MTLKAFVTDLETVPEELRAHYKQQEDGRYKFNAEDVEDVTGLKSALNHERDERRTAKQRLGQLLEQTEGLDLELAKKLVQEHEKGQRKKMIDEGEVEKLIEQETTKRVGKMKESHAGELETLTQERDKLRKKLESVLIDNSLQTEAAKAGVLPEALPDVIRRGRERFFLQDERVVAKDADGNILYGADGQTSQSPTEFMEELKGAAKHLFAASQGGGAFRQFDSGRSGARQGNENVRGVARMRQARSGA